MPQKQEEKPRHLPVTLKKAMDAPAYMDGVDLIRLASEKQEEKPRHLPVTLKKEMDATAYMDGVDLIRLASEMRNGFFPADNENLIVKFWLAELNRICVTLIFDEFLKKAGVTSGTILYCLEERDQNCVALGTLEMQSSGVRYVGSFRHQGMVVTALNVNAKQTKKEIAVPDDRFDGFSWYNDHIEGEKMIPVHYLPTKTFGGDVVFSFAVSGEFNLYMFFIKDVDTTLQPIFSKGFCCK